MEKICPKCNSVHTKNGIFCSRICANSRKWSTEDKLQKSISAKNSIKVKRALIKARILSKQIRALKPKLRTTINCLVCNKEIWIAPYKKQTRKYCSGSCRNQNNNKNIKGNRSKAEFLLEKELNNRFPHLNIEYNNREILNGLELDVYFPDLKFAIEWNGVFHYKSIKGSILEKYQIKDKLKKKKCEDLGIELLVIKDLTSHNKFINLTINNIINTLMARQERQRSPKSFYVGAVPTQRANFKMRV